MLSDVSGALRECESSMADMHIEHGEQEDWSNENQYNGLDIFMDEEDENFLHMDRPVEPMKVIFTNPKTEEEMLSFDEDGKFWVRGRLVEDVEYEEGKIVFNAFCDWLEENNPNISLPRL